MANNNPTGIGGFRKGQSGNPGGRARVLADVQELARQRSTEAIETLTEIMLDKEAPPAARALAANSLLDRGYGKPLQGIDVNTQRRSIKELPTEELMAIVAAADEDEPAEEPASNGHGHGGQQH